MQPESSIEFPAASPAAPPAAPSYLDAGGWGKPALWRYGLGILLTLFLWLGVGTFLTIALIILFQGPDGLQQMANSADPAAALTAGLNPIQSFWLVNAAFPLLALGVFLAVVLFHRRAWWSVITAVPTFRWQRLLFSGAAWFGISLLVSLVEFLIWPETFSLNFDPAVFVPFVIIALIVTPIQTSAEELFFRGYLIQAGGRLSRNRLLLTLVSAVLFALPHMSNPEVANGFWLTMLGYFVIGAGLAWFALLDGSLEIALGLHAANNLFAGIMVTFPSSALNTPALVYTTHMDPLYNLIAVLAALAIFYGLAYRLPRRWNARPF
jgi:membrane protease YdiL (CAAX protease family)